MMVLWLVFGNHEDAIKLGKYKHIAGKAIISATLITSVNKKGIVPNQIVCRGVFCITPLITNRFIPTGGETNPNSTTITANIPNHTGSIPASTITGKKTGIVKNNIAKESITVPSTR